MKIKHIFKVSTPLLALAIVGCSSTSNDSASADSTSSSDLSQAELQARTDALLAREAEVAKREANLATGSVSSGAGATTFTSSDGDLTTFTSSDGDLLPPSANPGECYARVWVEPTYKTVTEEVLVQEEGVQIDIIPAQYETVTETVEIQAASFEIKTIPAQYETVTEQVLLKPEERTWKIDLAKGAAPASQDLLDTASKYGIDLESATPGMCFHEHYIPAQFETVQEEVLVEEAYDVVDVQDAQYEWVEKEVLVKEASTKIVEVPAQYETVTEQVIDKPAHTVWKKGTGPIQKIDSATGEIMCLVEVPATYKTIKKRVLVSPARTEVQEIPAQYDVVKVRQVVSQAAEARRTIPAKYDTIAKTQKVAEASFVWHEVNNMDHPANTKTGKKICLTESPAEYTTVTKRVVVTPATTQQIEIPAEYGQVEVTKLVQEAQEVKTVIPAEYTTVTSRVVDQEGFMEWRSILCETNMTRSNIQKIQQSLLDRGYNPGPIDGVIGAQTIQAVNEFQVDNGIPTDRYLNIQTVQALGVAY